MSGPAKAHCGPPTAQFPFADEDFAHVTDIEQAGSGSNRKMLLNDAGIFDGHVPPAKLGHPGAQFLVEGMQGSFSQADGGRIHDAWGTIGIELQKAAQKLT